MSKENKIKKVVFEPGCFDHMEFESQEELDSLIKHISDMFEGMSEEELKANSHEVDLEQLAKDDPEFAQAIMQQLNTAEGRKLQ